MFCSACSCSASCMVGLLGVMGWWAFSFEPVLVDTFFCRVFGALFFLSLKISGKNQKSENEKEKKRGKPKEKKTPRKQKGQKIVENGKTKKMKPRRRFDTMFWFAVVRVFSPGVALRRRGPLPFSTSRFDIAEWPFSLVSWFDVVILSLFPGSSSSPRLGPVLRCRGPLSWSGVVVLASSWCRRSVSWPGPVL